MPHADGPGRRGRRSAYPSPVAPRFETRASTALAAGAVAAGAGAALALVHGLHPGDRDRVTLGDQVAAQLLLGDPAQPRITPGDQPRHGVHGEVPRLDPVELLPGH